MDVHAAMGDDRVLRRIIAMLVALAAVAERAGARSCPVRCLVLSILLRAEAVARDFVAEATGMPQPAIEAIATARNGPADANRLAARLLALANALGALLPVACRLARWPAWRGRAVGRIAPRPGRSLGGWTRKPNDTS